MKKNILILLIGCGLFLTLGTATAHAALAQDVDISAQSTTGSPVTASFSTTSGSELIVALISSDIDLSLTTTVSGAGLTWSRQLRNVAGGLGLTEVWTAYADSQLTNVTVSFTYSGSPGYDNTLLHVISFTGADSSLGATSTPSPGSGDTYATNNLITTRNNSWVWAVGEQWNTNSSHTAGTNQTITAEWADTNDDSHHWTQKQNNTTPVSGTSVTINNTAPTGGNTWIWSLFEIMPPAGPTTTPTPSPTPAPASREFTIAGWINPNSSIVSKAILVKNNELRLATNASGNLLCQFYDGSSWQSAVISSVVLTTGNWQHVACTYDRKTLGVFVNGSPSGNRQTLNNVIVNLSGSNWRFGSDESGTYSDFNGKIDDYRIYNRSLSPAEVQQLASSSPSPVGYWKLDENKGTTAYDSSGNGNNSTAWTGDTKWITGKYSSGLSFDGNGDALRLAETPSTDLGKLTDSYTVETWFKTQATYSQNGIIVGKNDNDPAYPFMIYIYAADQKVSFRVYGGGAGSVESTTAYSDGKWHHVAGVRDVATDKVYLYIDGVLNNSGNDDTTSSAANDSDVCFGNYPTNLDHGFNGQIDDVRIYNYSRTPAQIVEDMNSGHPAPGSPVGSAVAQYDFDEGYGTTAHNTGNGGSTLNATISGPAWTNSGKFDKALSFNGTGDFVESTTFPSLISGDFTFSAWINASSIATQKAIISNGSGSSSTEFSLMFDGDGKLDFRTYNGSNNDFKGNAVLTGNKWYHVVAVWEKDVRKSLYVNGVFDGSTASNVNITAEDTGIRIGKYSSTFPNTFPGLIDEVKIYNFALTQDQIATEYNQGKSQVMGSAGNTSTGAASDASSDSYCPPGQESACVGPMGEWNFDEQTGNTIHDISGNNQNMGSDQPKWVPGKKGSALNIKTGGSTYSASISYLDNATAFTMSFWAKINLNSSPGSEPVFVTDWTDASINMDVEGYPSFGAGTLCFKISNSTLGYGCASNLFTLGQWFHVTEIYNGNGAANADRIKAFINGQPVNLTIWGGTIPTSLGVHTAGSFSAISSALDSTVDDLKVYNYTRTPAQVAWDYNRGAPVAQYDFDECTGTILHDVAPKADRAVVPLNGVITPNTGRTAGNCSSGVSTEMWNGGTTGKYSSSLAFDGVGDYVDAGNPTALQLTTAGTVAVWIKNTTPSWGNNPVYVCKMDWGTDNNGYCLAGYPNGGGITGELSDGASAPKISSTRTDYNDGLWHHVVFTWDGTWMKLYIDGSSAAAPVSQLITPISNIHNLTIGKDPASSNAGYYFNGQIDDLRIYNYALTPVQVKTLYNNSSAVAF